MRASYWPSAETYWRAAATGLVTWNPCRRYGTGGDGWATCVPHGPAPYAAASFAAGQEESSKPGCSQPSGPVRAALKDTSVTRSNGAARVACRSPLLTRSADGLVPRPPTPLAASGSRVTCRSPLLTRSADDLVPRPSTPLAASGSLVRSTCRRPISPAGLSEVFTAWIAMVFAPGRSAVVTSASCPCFQESGTCGDAEIRCLLLFWLLS